MARDKQPAPTGANLFTNRQLSWLEFNQRVLEEALDPTTPLLERLKFLCIVSSNFDEFFQIRVAGLMQQEQHAVAETESDGLGPTAALEAISARVHQIVAAQYACLNEQVLPGLRKAGIRLLRRAELDAEQRAWVRQYFERHVRPVLTPLAVNPSHPFPHLLNQSLNFAVTLEGESPFGQDNWVAIVQAPRILPRIIPLPGGRAERRDFVMLSSVIHQHVDQLFTGLAVTGCHQFRVTRNSDLYVEEEDAENLLAAIEEELRQRDRGAAVRLELAAGCAEEVQQFLLQQLNLTERELYVVAGPVNLHRLMAILEACPRPELRDPPYSAPPPPALRATSDVLGALRRRSVLVHHPYESFGCVVDFLRQAATDPGVLAIKQTLYRTSGDSPVVDALMAAAANHKQVAAIVELKARFDEAANIRWARALEEAGVHVVYGIPGVKVHAKLSLVVRREGDRIKRYAHLGTGNYHPATARLYTDLGFFTADDDYTADVAGVFDLMTGAGHPPPMRKLLVAPFELHGRLLKLIEAERQAAKAGKPCRIVIKANALVERKLILALYRASQAGVPIDLNIRGICALRPGVKGVSDNIRVTSIVGRYLEHSRIAYFHHGGEELVYLGSADLMPRNLFRRIEVAFPVEDPALRRRLTHEILPAFLADNQKARVLQADGGHKRVKLPSPDDGFSAQAYLMKVAHGKGRKVKLEPVAGLPPRPVKDPLPL